MKTIYIYIYIYNKPNLTIQQNNLQTQNNFLKMKQSQITNYNLQLEIAVNKLGGKPLLFSG